MYDICLNYASTTLNNANLNSHLMKNSEWGAVAYLAQSVYGKNSEVAVNQCSYYITGAGPGLGNSNVYNSNYAYNSTTFNTDYAYFTENGQKASTTGNIYGIYDMSGGAREYVAAYVDNGAANLSNGGTLTSSTADSKTRDAYPVGKDANDAETQEENYKAAVSIYGDVIYETSSSYTGTASWFGDYAYFPRTASPFFMRGGYYTNTSYAGLFYLYYSTGTASNFTGFRPVLVVL